MENKENSTIIDDFDFDASQTTEHNEISEFLDEGLSTDMEALAHMSSSKNTNMSQKTEEIKEAQTEISSPENNDIRQETNDKTEYASENAPNFEKNGAEGKSQEIEKGQTNTASFEDTDSEEYRQNEEQGTDSEPTKAQTDTPSPKNDDTGQKTIKEIQTDTPSSKINQDLNSFYSKILILKYIFDAKEKAIETIKSRQKIGIKNGEENSPKEENTNQRRNHLGGSSETHQNASIKKMVNVAQVCSNLDENFLKGKFSGMIQDFFKASKGLSAKELDVLEKYIKEKQKDTNENFASDYQKFINSFFTKEELEKLSGTPQDLEYRLKIYHLIL